VPRSDVRHPPFIRHKNDSYLDYFATKLKIVCCEVGMHPAAKS
jgi:hypothetical protein